MKNLIFLTLIFSLLIIWGCNKSNPSESVSEDQSFDQAMDEAAIQSSITDVEESDESDYFYSNLDDENESSFGDMGGMDPYNLLKPINPFRFGRIARPIFRDIRIIFDTDTTATVMFRKVMRGKFIILAQDTTGQDSLYRVTKRLGHEFKRIAHFVKRGKNTEHRRGWKLVDFSMVEGKSYDFVDSTFVNPQIDIVKIEVQSDSTDTTITDPLAFFQTKQSVFQFGPGTNVTVTVYVDNAIANPVIFPAGTQATEIVRLHHARHRRFRMHGIRYLHWIGQDGSGNNIYQGNWTTGMYNGVRHAVIDVIDNGTIFDDDEAVYPYRSVTWGTPYMIRGN